MPNKHYPPEYKRRVLDLVRSGRPVTQLAREFSLPEGTIFRWMRQAKIDRGQIEGVTTDEKAELARLRREVAELREEKEILKKFAAWSAQEANWTPKKRSDS